MFWDIGRAVIDRVLRTVRSLTKPFERDVPPAVRDELILDQFARLRAITPELSLVIVLSVIAAVLALLGDLPWWRQFVPPAMLLTGCLALMIGWRRQTSGASVETAKKILGRAAPIAAVFGLISGLWCVSAFAETERYYCVVAPVFVSLSVLMVANCASSAPHAALAGVVTAFAPICAKMLAFDNLGIRSIAVMMIVIGAMQLRLIYAKFDERVRTIGLEHELRLLAETDPLTGLDNRRAFDRKLTDAIAEGNVAIAMVDLNAFKAVNDCHGHAAGDAMLVEAGRRLRAILPDSRSIARLGGDEFGLILTPEQASDARDAIRAALGLPVAFEDVTIPMSASVGLSRGPDDGTTDKSLRTAADKALYVDKARRRRGTPATLAA